MERRRIATKGGVALILYGVSEVQTDACCVRTWKNTQLVEQIPMLDNRYKLGTHLTDATLEEVRGLTSGHDGPGRLLIVPTILRFFC